MTILSTQMSQTDMILRITLRSTKQRCSLPFLICPIMHFNSCAHTYMLWTRTDLYMLQSTLVSRSSPLLSFCQHFVLVCHEFGLLLMCWLCWLRWLCLVLMRWIASNIFFRWTYLIACEERV